MPFSHAVRRFVAPLFVLLVGLGSALHAQAARPTPGQKVILVTGATSGLGREVARRLAAGGAHVILHGRDSARGAEVLGEIRAAGKGSARFYTADLSVTADVRRFGETILKDYDRLDVLINNAGIGTAPDVREVTAEGYESRFQVNYLSGFLLTRILLPRLLSSAPSRIVNVSSLSAAPIDFDDVMIEQNFTGRRAYGQSKLAQIMFTFDLAAELEGKGVTVNALHPATLMPTGMVARGGYTPRSTVDDGTRAVLQLVLDDVGTGKFYNSMELGKPHAQAHDAEARAKLKQVSERLTGLSAR
ncbi:MAG: SDR family NAD(P)-dependent oxidoreductase [Gemmatimonadales bacterium]